MTWITRWQLNGILADRDEARTQVWELTSDVIDLRIDNENQQRKIEEYDAFLAALHKVKGRGA